MQDRSAASTLAETLTFDLPNGRSILLKLAYVSETDELPETATRVVAGMLDAFWDELMELE